VSSRGMQMGTGCSMARAFAALLFTAVLAGCASPPPGGVNVVDRSGNRPGAVVHRQPITAGQYVVQRGDTLYSIAFRYGWDWKALAARNGIVEPYLIRVGQVIRFDGQPVQPSTQVSTAPTRPIATQPPVQTAPARPVQPAPRPQSPPPVASAPPVSAPPSQRSASGWIWPSQGAVISRFSSNGSLNKGIDIAGELGQPVSAASDGSVVYAGSGLRGYGELLIIKHSDTYVSAYGHNRRLLVQEGQKVKAGQVIAEMGSTGTDRVKLHFEIRRQGKPVDPLQYLPRR
jgi:lipoprotein NlpD